MYNKQQHLDRIAKVINLLCKIFKARIGKRSNVPLVTFFKILGYRYPAVQAYNYRKTNKISEKVEKNLIKIEDILKESEKLFAD